MTPNDKNPHIRRMERIQARSGLEMSEFDRQIAAEKGTKPCGSCGQPAYFKPTVGTWVCLCGALYRLGEWIKRTR